MRDSGVLEDSRALLPSVSPNFSIDGRGSSLVACIDGTGSNQEDGGTSEETELVFNGA